MPARFFSFIGLLHKTYTSTYGAQIISSPFFHHFFAPAHVRTSISWFDIGTIYESNKRLGLIELFCHKTQTIMTFIGGKLSYRAVE